MRPAFLMAAAVFLCAAAVAPVFAQGRTSVWNGVYTDEQAAHGATRYQACAMCHGADLEGNGEAPPLVGRFIPDWAGTTLDELFDKIQTTMPLYAPGTLSASDTADILAFILKSNNFPAGRAPLAADGDAFKLIRFDAARPPAASSKRAH